MYLELTNSQIETFLKKPYADISLIIVFGPDDGLCQERLSSLIKNLEIDINDPFSTSILNSEDFKSYSHKLLDEAFSITFSGEKKLVLFKSNGFTDLRIAELTNNSEEKIRESRIDL